MRDFSEEPGPGLPGPNGLGWRFHESYMDRQMAYKEKSRLTSTHYHYYGRGGGRAAQVQTMLGYPKKMICPSPPPNSFREGYVTKSSEKLAMRETSVADTYASLFGSGAETNLWLDDDPYGSIAPTADFSKQRPKTPVPFPTTGVVASAGRKPQANLSRTTAVTNFHSSKVIASGVAEIMKSALPIVRAVPVKKLEVLKPSASLTGSTPAPSKPIRKSRQPQRAKPGASPATTTGNVVHTTKQRPQTVKTSKPAAPHALVQVNKPPKSTPQSQSHVLPPPTNAVPGPRPKNGNQSSARIIYPQLRRNNFQT